MTVPRDTREFGFLFFADCCANAFLWLVGVFISEPMKLLPETNPQLIFFVIQGRVSGWALFFSGRLLSGGAVVAAALAWAVRECVL